MTFEFGNDLHSWQILTQLETEKELKPMVPSHSDLDD
jgi:hypothetical protein